MIGTEITSLFRFRIGHCITSVFFKYSFHEIIELRVPVTCYGHVLSLAEDIKGIHIDDSNYLGKREKGIFDIIFTSKQSLLFTRNRKKKNRPALFFRKFCKCLCNLEKSCSTSCIINSTI